MSQISYRIQTKSIFQSFKVRLGCFPVTQGVKHSTLSSQNPVTRTGRYKISKKCFYFCGRLGREDTVGRMMLESEKIINFSLELIVEVEVSPFSFRQEFR
jgi:hypothetical protein